MSCNSNYITNDILRLSLVVETKADSAPIDPTSVSAAVKDPAGYKIDVTSSIVRDGVGLYHVDYLPTMTGEYIYEFIGTGAAEIAALGQFLVTRATF